MCGFNFRHVGEVHDELMDRCDCITGFFQQLQVAKGIPDIGGCLVQAFFNLPSPDRESLTDLRHTVCLDIHAFPDCHRSFHPFEHALAWGHW
ncbi:hypothetical protein D3C76_1480870 [compost metagenome]